LRGAILFNGVAVSAACAKGILWWYELLSFALREKGELGGKNIYPPKFGGWGY